MTAPESAKIASSGEGVARLAVANRVVSADSSDGVYGVFNHAASLRAGHLLLVYLGHNACFQIDPTSGQAEYLFRLGRSNAPFLWRAIAGPDHRVLCTLSGGKDLVTPEREAFVGAQGWIASVDFALGDIRLVAQDAELVDPCGMNLVGESELLIADFNGFGGRGGAILAIDLASNAVTELSRGGLLKDPVSAVRTADGTLWVANAMMEGYDKENGGEILRIDPDGRQVVVVPQSDVPTGTYVGLCLSPVDDELLVVKNDMPLMRQSALLRLDTRSGALEPIDLGDAPLPRCYATHIAVQGDVVWVTESYQRVLFGYDVVKREVVHRHSLAGILGDFLGLVSTFEGIESVSVVPG